MKSEEKFRFCGETVCEGTGSGPAVIRRKNRVGADKREIRDPEAETERVMEACAQAEKELQALHEAALGEVKKEEAAIFDAYQMLLKDEEYLEEILGKIRAERVNAECAVAAAKEKFSDMLEKTEDDLMRARAEDIRHLSDRLIGILSGRPEETLSFPEPSVLVAEELSPGDVIRADREKVSAIVMVHGSVNSHAAILAKMRNIPTLAGVPVDFDRVRAGMQAFVNGYKGEVIFGASHEISPETKSRMEEEADRARFLQTLKGKENVTLDGHSIELLANISGEEEIEAVLENDAGGIGLFRSEFLYLGRRQPPAEEEQFQVYRRILQAMGGKKVIIRTADIGADKQEEYFHLEKERNPALGCRGIRICLRYPEMFKTQLRALLRAAVYGKLSIMYPMITSVKELQRIGAIMDEVKKELEDGSIPFQMPAQGIMIETPAAVMISDELAESADFFSIGTNDLTQYALAADRQNEGVRDVYDPHHKAVLKMIRMVVENAHRHGIPVGICGELGADPELTEWFVRTGVDELSVAPSRILRLRKAVRELRYFH